jgi:DNA-binding response OmpR family regulator
LLIEDEELIRETAALALTEEGYDVNHGGGRKTALKSLLLSFKPPPNQDSTPELQPDLVISGLQCCSNINGFLILAGSAVLLGG